MMGGGFGAIPVLVLMAETGQLNVFRKLGLHI